MLSQFDIFLLIYNHSFRNAFSFFSFSLLFFGFSFFNNNVDLAGRIIKDENGVEVFNFGKHKGKSVAEVLKREPSFYAWMMDADFPLNTKQVLTKIKLREMQK